MKKKLTLLMVALVTVVAFAAQTFRAAETVIYSWPSGATAANKVTLAEGVTVAITGNPSKSVSNGNPITVNGTEYTSIKLSNGAQNTLTLPKKAKAITFYSYVNADAGDTYWKEVAGVNYTAETSGGIMTSFKDGANPDVRKFELATPANVITFTNQGKQLCYVIEVEYAEETSDEPIVMPEGAEEWEVTAGKYAVTFPLLNIPETPIGEGKTGLVKFDGSDVYVQIAAANIVTITLKGQLNGNQVIFPKNLTTTISGATIYLIGADENKQNPSDVIFTYDEANGTLTQSTPYIIASTQKDAISEFAYLKELQVKRKATEPGSDIYYEKVTSTADIVDGDYLIVYEAENVAFNGALETLDAAKNTIPVEINSGVIASSETVDAAIFTFDTTEKTIKSASGFYVGITSYGNGLKQSATLTDKFKHNSFAIDDDKNVIITKTYDAGDMILNYNSNASDKRFRYYKGGSQKKIQLYKKIGGSTEPETKVATSIELGEYATTAEVGAEYSLPTATVKDVSGATVDGATITWSSSDETVATIDGTSLTLLKAGTTTLTAIYAGDATYEGSTKGYILTVTAPAAEVATVAELNALDDKAEFTFTGEALIVAKPTNRYVFIRDNTGSSLIYDNSGSKTEAAAVGKTIAANWTGKVSIYNSLFEAVPDAAITVTDAEAIEPDYPEVGFDDITAENVNKVVMLKEVTYTLGSGKILTFAKNEATVAGYNQFNITIDAAEEGRTYNVVGAIGRYNNNIQFQPISIERVPAAKDIEIAAADITDGDITAAIETALAGDFANNVTINLAAGNYTVSKPIVAAGNVIINGNGASIDASTLTNPFIQLSGTTEYVTLPDNTKDASHLFVENVILKDLTIKGMPDAIIRDTQKTLLKNLTIDNCNIQVPNKVFINFQSKGYIETVTVKSSTIWSADNAQFFAQYGSRLKNLSGAEAAGWLQTFDIQNSTFYNIAIGKNVCDFPMNSQKCNVYTLKNNIFVNCGKEGQTVVGFNKGGKSANPVWTVDGNLFNYNGADKSATEVEKAGKKDGENIVKNSIAGVVTFTDAANGDFGGSIDGQVAWGAEVPATVGDPRWTITLNVTNAPAVPDGDYFVAGLSYDPLMWMNTTVGAASKYGTQITTEYDKTTKTTALKVGEQYLQADLTLGTTAFGWTVDEDAVYGHNIYKMDGDKKMYIGTDNATNKLTLIEDATNSSIGWGFFYPDDFYGALALREITGDISGDMTLNEQTGLWEYTAKLVEVTAEKQPAIQVVINGEVQRTYPAEPRVITLTDMGNAAEAGYYDITITYNDEGNVIAISGTKVEPAEITKVQISGAPYGVDQWTSLDFAVDPTQGNVYTATLDLSETTENYQFKLVINDGGTEADNWGGWIGTNNVTVDAPEGWGYWTDENEDNKTLWLYNSTTGYKTYTLTATWTPSDNAYKGWTLKIEGKDERTAILAGDANLDNEVTVSDAVLAVSFVTEKETPTAEQLLAADLDKNNKVDITDVQGIVNIALGITEQANSARAIELAENTLSIDGTQLLLQNQTMFTGFQMDVTLENGAELNGVQLSDRAKDMTLVYNKVGDNTWRIAAISLSRTAISGNDGCLLTLDVNGNGNVNVNNNLFTDANTQSYILPFAAPTGISAIKAAIAEGTVIYDMQGRRVENPTKGLYMVNGKKVVLK